MSKLEVSARMTVRKGKLEEFKQQAAECIRQTKEKDTKTVFFKLPVGFAVVDNRPVDSKANLTGSPLAAYK